MPGAPDYVRKKFAPMLDRTLRNALAHQIAKQFPRIGGPRIRQLCADLILQTLAAPLRPREAMRHGQVLWAAISVDDPPARRHPRPHRAPVAPATPSDQSRSPLSPSLRAESAALAVRSRRTALPVPARDQ